MYVLDEPAAIEKKFKRAVTDSGSEIARAPREAGRLQPDRDPRRRARRQRPSRSKPNSPSPRYGDLKAAVAEAVVEKLAPVRERYVELRADEASARGDAGATAPSEPGR